MPGVAPLFRPNRQRANRLKAATAREFDGGWNVIDNDLNLSTRFAKEFDNVSRFPDGSVGVRWGTRLFADLGAGNPVAGVLVEDPFTTSTGPPSPVVKVTFAGHKFQAGHRITISNVVGDVNNIPAVELNATHVITSIVDVNTFEITVSSNANANGTGGGLLVNYAFDNSILPGVIVNAWYFEDHLIVVDSTGTIVKVDASGESQTIWNQDFATLLSGSPTAWGATTFASADVFDGFLIIANGVDKPLEVKISVDPIVNFLQDLGTSSNANTPVARYVTAMNRYLVLTGDPLEPDAVHIGSVDTRGTFAGDAAPNNAVKINLGQRASSSDNTIRGARRLRDNLIVALNEAVVIGKLGVGVADVTDAHVPDFNDVISQHGSLSHRAMVPLGVSDMLLVDHIGVPSLERSTFTNSLKPERVSQLIDPEIQKDIQPLTTAALEDHIFAVHNQREGQYMLFIPNDSDKTAATETKCYVYTVIPSLKVKAWARFRGWNWSCGVRSALGRIFFGENNGSKLYVYGAEEDQLYGDFVNDPDIDEPELGEEINFTWELPWTDLDERSLVKTSRHIAIDSRGNGPFTLSGFVDNFLVNPAGNAFTPAFSTAFNTVAEFTPQLSMEFVGGDSFGFGVGDQPYGAGRIASEERLWGWTARFKIMKLRFTGSTRQKLRFISITLSYLLGSPRR